MHKHGQLGMGMRIRCRLRPSSRRRCRLLGGDTAAFCASLVEGLAHLESTLEVDHQSGTVSMRWCADAMRLVKRMQREMLAIFRKADVPVAVSSSGGGAAGDWFEHYMQETEALLDFCNAFKAAVSRMHRYCMVVDFAAQVIVGRGRDGGAGAAASLVVESAAEPEPCQAQPSSAAFRDNMADAKAAVAEAERLGRAIIISGGGGDDAGSMVVVTLVAKITTSVLSMFVLQALTAPPAAVDNCGVRPTITASAVDVDVFPPELEPWCESLSLIHARFPSPAAVAEHEKVATAVRDLVSGKVDGGGRGEQQQEELLRARSGELREGVEMFDCVLDEVFDEVIRGRNEMLGILRDKALT
ncbi:unnamed protein product [Miscanthus lutarioriparius]|uniref:Uncharacterized protein n=1 Tax=Miscanthus lutarioriparius TaxID=422564 RepID=A0A811QNW1_9POAL|nr:unnamed protein product [Miscanthus lutarioriparius]CAD6257725.1 unnamed protein product [Miscanthus lutarioriparius]